MGAQDSHSANVDILESLFPYRQCGAAITHINVCLEIPSQKTHSEVVWTTRDHFLLTVRIISAVLNAYVGPPLGFSQSFLYWLCVEILSAIPFSFLLLLPWFSCSCRCHVGSNLVVRHFPSLEEAEVELSASVNRHQNLKCGEVP